MDGQNFHEIEDRSLLELVMKGNELAFSQLYERYWDSLFIAAFKVLKDEESSKDIVQEIFLGIWESETLDTIQNVPGYLHKMVRYKVLMLLRRGRVAERHLQTIPAPVANTTDDILSFQELSETIESAIDKLPQKCGEVFRMSRIDHLSNQEIADRLNISVRTVETHISNALRYLRSSMTPSLGILLLLLA